MKPPLLDENPLEMQQPGGNDEIRMMNDETRLSSKVG